MEIVEREIVRREIDALVSALEEARFRHVAGMDPAPSLTDLFQAHGRAAHRETVKALQAMGEGELSIVVASLRAERAQAADEETWRAAETAAVAAGPDGPVALGEAQLAVVRERDRSRRVAFGRAVAEAAAVPAREAAVEQRARGRAEVGLTPDWDRVVEGDAALSLSDDGYRDVLHWAARREAELTPAPGGDLTRADLLFVLALHGYDGLFPRGMLAIALERTVAALRLDLRRIRIDDGTRPGQWPGAHAQGTRVSLRRQGGAADWLGLFEAVGQALGAAHVPPHRRDPAMPATLGALLAGLLLDQRFLSTRLDLDRRYAADVVRALALRQLFRVRATAAALRVASEVERGLTGSSWHDAHREAMTLAAAATWPVGLAARDGDASAAAALLRGAARAEALRRSFVERLDEDWWRNPRTADALGTILAAGATPGEEPPPALAAEGLMARLQ